MIAALKRWLMAQGFTERVAVLVMWQAAILCAVIIVILGTLLLRK